MFLQHLYLLNFKNYSETTLLFSEKINCFVGNNGVGKTNLLDAIHYLSLCKSYFNIIDSQNIKHGEDFFVIQGKYERFNSEEEIYCGFKSAGRKVFRRNKKEYERLADHIGLLPIVMITPSDIMLITEGSEERRKLIDSIISQFDNNYLSTLIKYNKILAQRNKLLKEQAKSRKFDDDILDVYTDQLVTSGQSIYERRKQFIDSLIPVFQKYYNFISNGTEKVELIYQSQLNENDYKRLMEQSLQKDRMLEYTSAGIHKDDLQLLIQGHPVKRIGSQGQQKTYLVALKLADFEFLAQVSGLKPVLLLDDIFDKFDSERVSQIIRLAAGENFGQIFITDTDLNRIQSVLKEISFEHRIFTIEHGNINQIDEP
jgi:DNA replication and repair protein RecF